jgi:hypothetical protein
MAEAFIGTDEGMNGHDSPASNDRKFVTEFMNKIG